MQEETKSASALMMEIEDFVIKYRVKNIADLVYYARKKRPDWHALIVENRNALEIIREFCHQTKDSKYILPWPENISYDEDDDALKEDDVLLEWTEQERRRRNFDS